MRKTRKFRTGDKSRVWRDDVKNENTCICSKTKIVNAVCLQT